jgi:hypothetical protein
MKLKIGDVFWFEVVYSNGERVIRPVVIINFINGVPLISTFVALTHSEIKDFDGKFDKWKVPLFGANKDGLGDSSYAKANCVAEVDASAFKRKDYIGNLNRRDVENIKKRVLEFIDSEEDSW